MKIIKIVPLLSMFLLLSSCASEEQNKAFSEISGLYGCNVNFSKGFSTSTEKGNAKYFELNISNCTMIDQEKIEPEVAASGSALILFKSFSEEEKSNYAKISVEIKKNSKNNETTSSFDYSLPLLRSLEKQEVYMKAFLGSMKRKDVKGCYSHLNDYVTKDLTSEGLDSVMQGVDKEFGPIKEIQEHGFKFIKYTDEVPNGELDLLLLSGSYIREKGNTTLEVYIDTTKTVRNIYGIKF
jgi:hypothetical protein